MARTLRKNFKECLLTNIGLMLLGALFPCEVFSTNNTTTYSGVIPASCSFVDIANNVNFQFQPSNSLSAEMNFSVNSNITPIRVSLSRVTVDEEPANIRTGTKPYVVLTDPNRANLQLTQPAYVASEGDPIQQLNNVINQDAAVKMTTTVVTNGSTDGYYYLNKGRYVYSVVVTCLEGV